MSASAVLSHRLPSPPISTTKQNTVKKHTSSTNALRAVHRHRDFFPATMRLVAKPLRPIHDKLSTILTDFVWLRFLEDSRAQGFERKPPSRPKVTYPPGLPGLDILMADLEALMNYAGYIQHFFEVWTIPLPELYDPEKVRDYFNCRPHVLMFRILEVLGKVWSIALKYHFRMPPYFTLVLRSLASFEGMAVAADKNFRTFQAAYPYVVNKLLYDNSASTRRILYSVIFNKTREIQWEKILIFLNIGLLRIRSTGIGSSSSNMPEHKIGKQDVYKLANLMLVLLPSKDGAVLRRLLMTADPVSLTRSMISKNAITFRQHASVILADVIYGRLLKASIGDDSSGRYTGLLLEMEGQAKTSCDSQFYTIMRDRRLMLIFYRIVGQVRRHPVLMVRACWSCFTIVAMALVISLPRFVANCLQSFVTSLSFLPRKIAVGF